jgi:hypothetical protein
MYFTAFSWRTVAALHIIGLTTTMSDKMYEIWNKKNENIFKNDIYRTCISSRRDFEENLFSKSRLTTTQ